MAKKWAESFRFNVLISKIHCARFLCTPRESCPLLKMKRNNPFINALLYCIPVNSEFNCSSRYHMLMMGPSHKDNPSSWEHSNEMHFYRNVLPSSIWRLYNQYNEQWWMYFYYLCSQVANKLDHFLSITWFSSSISNKMVNKCRLILSIGISLVAALKNWNDN